MIYIAQNQRCQQRSLRSPSIIWPLDWIRKDSLCYNAWPLLQSWISLKLSLFVFQPTSRSPSVLWLLCFPFILWVILCCVSGAPWGGVPVCQLVFPTGGSSLQSQSYGWSPPGRSSSGPIHTNRMSHFTLDRPFFHRWTENSFPSLYVTWIQFKNGNGWTNTLQKPSQFLVFFFCPSWHKLFPNSLNIWY